MEHRKTETTRDMFVIAILLAAIVAVVMITPGCSTPPRPIPELVSVGSANRFVQTVKKDFGNAGAVENSLVRVGDTIVALYDPFSNGTMFRAELGADGRGFSNALEVHRNARLSYVLEHRGELLAFVTRGYDVDLMSSSDGGFTWTERGRALTHDADRDSIHHEQWNVAVAVDDSETFHMLIESRRGSGPPFHQGGVGLTHLTAKMIDGRLDFNPSKKREQVIRFGGNAWLVHVPGKGLLALHGLYGDPFGEFGIEWFTTASTFDGSKWTTHQDRFRIGTPSVHVCDPHAIEVDGRILLTLSVDQNSIYRLEAPDDSFAALFDRLVE